MCLNCQEKPVRKYSFTHTGELTVLCMPRNCDHPDYSTTYEMMKQLRGVFDTEEEALKHQKSSSEYFKLPPILI